MELSLIRLTNKKTNKTTYHAVNDKHYDGMLASGGSNLDLEYEWAWIGDVEISEDVLNEQGYFIKWAD